MMEFKMEGFNTTKENKIEKEDSLEERYKKEILPLINALCPDGESLEEYEEQVMTDLEESLKKIQIAQGRIVELDENKNFEEIKGLLISRIKSVLKDDKEHYSKDDKEKPDPDLVFRSKIALLLSGDFSDLQLNCIEYKNGEYIPKPIERLDFDNLDCYLDTRFNKKEKKLTEKVLNELVKVGLGSQMATIQSYNLTFKVKNIPESFILELIKKHDAIYLNEILKKYSSQKKYTHEVSRELILKGYTYIVLENIEKFNDLNLDYLKSLIMNYSPEYPFHLGDILKYLEKLKWEEDERVEIIDFVFKHQWIGYEDLQKISDEEIRGKYKKVCDNIGKDNFFRNKAYEKILLENYPKELEKIKKHIENGYITFFGFNSEYLKYFFENDYEWLRDQMIKNNQENLILGFLKQEDQEKYAEKLINQNDIGILKSLLRENGRFSENYLSQKIYEKLLENNYIAPLNCFSNLDENIFSKILKEKQFYLENFELFKNINKFNFKEDSNFKEYKNYKEFVKYINSCYNESAQKFYVYFRKDFCFESYDFRKDGELRKYIREKADLLERIARKAYTHYFNSDKDPDWTKVGTNILDQYTHNQNASKNEMLGQEEFNLLQKYGIDCVNRTKVTFFDNLNEEIFEKYFKNSIFLKNESWDGIKSVLNRFNFGKDSAYPKLIDKIENITENSKLRKYCLEFEPESKREYIFQLIKECQSLDDSYELINLYINKFKDLDDFDETTIKLKKEFVEKYKTNIDSLIRNKKIECSDNEEYRVVCEAVYPKRNRNTYNYINEYKDRSEDLDPYTFNKEGYKIRLSGVVGYKIKDGYEKNPDLLLKYQNRIRNIEKIATSEENLLNFINTNLPNTESRTLEGKIIEYIRKNHTDSVSVDLLLAYQLHGHYDQFVRESTDRTDMYEKMEGKEYVMLSELSERYGDLMKETLKEIGKKVNISEDKKLFIKDIGDEVKKGEKLSFKIFEELSKISEDRLTTIAIQKKVAKSIRNTFQQLPSIEVITESFAGSFTKENFSSFQNIFKEKIKEIFQEINNEVFIDIQELETLRKKTYEEIKDELNKYEEIKEKDESKKGEVKMSKERLIKGYFSKNRENAHARMIGDICIATDPKMLENKNYFEFVLFDELRKKCVGTTMLLKMEEPDGKKYLLYCPNPSVDLVSQVSAEKLYKLITKEVASFADKNKFDGILVDKQHGHSTNRSGLFQTSLKKSILHNNKDEEIIFNLKNKHQLSDSYVYQKNLNAVWLRKI